MGRAVDYDETFAPVIRQASLKLMMALATGEETILYAKLMLKPHFYGLLDEEIYISQPEGFEDNTGRVCPLRKAIYELRQSPRMWNKFFAEILLSIEVFKLLVKDVEN